MTQSVTATLAAGIREVKGDLVNIRTGICLSTADRTTGVVSVKLDNDPSGTPVTAISTAGLLEVGSRVVCLAYPPRGLIVLGQIGGVPNLQFLESHDYTNIVGITSNVAATGAIVVGFAFTAPTSGQILLEVAPSIDLLGLGTRGRVFAQVREGSVVGSGALTWDGDGDQGPLVVGQNQLAAGTAVRYVMGSGETPLVGLTPGHSYNASLWYRLENSGVGLSMNVNSRRITGLLVA